MHLNFSRRKEPEGWVSFFAILPRPTARGLVVGHCERRIRWSYAEYGTYTRSGWEYRPRGSGINYGADETVAFFCWMAELTIIFFAVFALLPLVCS